MTKNKAINIVSLMFVVMIGILFFSLIKQFTILDLAYLLFIVGCFIRYIYIKTH